MRKHGFGERIEHHFKNSHMVFIYAEIMIHLRNIGKLTPRPSEHGQTQTQPSEGIIKFWNSNTI